MHNFVNRFVSVLAMLGVLVAGMPVQPAHAASIVVNTNTDKGGLLLFDGLCGLREAITNANNDLATYPDCAVGSGADTINISGAITLSLGELLITSAMTIHGGSVKAASAPAVATWRVYEVSPSGNLTLDNTEALNGRCNGLCSTASDQGGAIYVNGGALTLTNSQIRDSSAGEGGGIYNNGGQVNFSNGVIWANTAEMSGGGIYSYGGSLSMSGGEISRNHAATAGNAGDGGGMYNYHAAVNLTNNVDFDQNTAVAGGGMYNDEGVVTIIGGHFLNNNAQYGGAVANTGGSPSLSQVLIWTNVASADGGGMYNENSSPSLTQCRFYQNTAIHGGGMDNVNSSPSLVQVELYGNQAEYGGAMANSNSSVSLRGVSLIANVANVNGGGMYNQDSGGGSIENVTLAGNDAAAGGGLYNQNSSLALTNVTLNANTAMNGGAMFNLSSNPALKSVILWGDSAAAGLEVYDVFSQPSLDHSVVSGGCNTIGGAVCGSGNLSSDPMLGPLRADGGSTQTMALLPGSSAIDGGDPGNCPPEDQRGLTRPQLAHCDMGAFEAQGGVFNDVPESGKEWMETWIDVLYYHGITTGCGAGPIYCPENPVTRASMAVFILRAKHGSTYVPPAATHTFADMPVAGKEWMEPWVDQLYAEGITSGCGVSPLTFCPEAAVTRASMAVFLLRALEGSSYTPPAATHTFSDMPVTGKEWMEPWVDEFYTRGITTGCSASPFNYCPESSVTRAAMAVFIDRAYGLYP